MVLKKAKWFSVASNGLRQSRQKYKSEMDKSRYDVYRERVVNLHYILWRPAMIRTVCKYSR